MIAGERRFRALKFLGETEVPVIIREVSDRKALELSLIENLQREELNPIDQADAYKRLIEEFGLTQEQVAEAVGKDRATVANTLRVLRLAPQVREEIKKGTISLGAARTLCGLESQKLQWSIGQRIVSEGLSVRQLEQIVKKLSGGAGAGGRGVPARGSRDPHLVAAENKLQRSLGTKVEIDHGRSRGWIRIAYFSLKDLDRLLGRLTAGGNR